MVLFLCSDKAGFITGGNICINGGSIGAWLGMKVWHHKTMHRKFRYGVPLILAVQIALILLASCKSGQTVVLSEPIQGEQSGQEHSPNVFLVMYDERVGKEPLRKAVKSYGCEIIYDYNTINGMALKKPDGRTLEETMQYFRGVKGVLTVEYDHIIRLTDPAEPDQRR